MLRGRGPGFDGQGSHAPWVSAAEAEPELSEREREPLVEHRGAGLGCSLAADVAPSLLGLSNPGKKKKKKKEPGQLETSRDGGSALLPPNRGSVKPERAGPPWIHRSFRDPIGWAARRDGWPLPGDLRAEPAAGSAPNWDRDGPPPKRFGFQPGTAGLVAPFGVKLLRVAGREGRDPGRGGSETRRVRTPGSDAEEGRTAGVLDGRRRSELDRESRIAFPAPGGV